MWMQALIPCSCIQSKNLAGVNSSFAQPGTADKPVQDPARPLSAAALPLKLGSRPFHTPPSEYVPPLPHRFDFDGTSKLFDSPAALLRTPYGSPRLNRSNLQSGL